MVFDVVFNLVVMRQSAVNKQLKAFLVNLAMMWISQKHNIELKPGTGKKPVFWNTEWLKVHYIKLILEMIAYFCFYLYTYRYELVLLHISSMLSNVVSDSHIYFWSNLLLS
jgi:hypothetical protein